MWMKKITLTTILLSYLSFLSANDIGLSCGNFTGVSLDYENGSPKASKDGYSGTNINIAVGQAGGLIKYTGRINRTDDVRLLAGSKDGYLSYYKTFNDVHKIYTIFTSDPIVLSITEIQTRLYDGTPQIRTFMGNCR